MNLHQNELIFGYEVVVNMVNSHIKNRKFCLYDMSIWLNKYRNYAYDITFMRAWMYVVRRREYFFISIKIHSKEKRQLIRFWWVAEHKSKLKFPHISIYEILINVRFLLTRHHEHSISFFRNDGLLFQILHLKLCNEHGYFFRIVMFGHYANTNTNQFGKDLAGLVVELMLTLCSTLGLAL